MLRVIQAYFGCTLEQLIVNVKKYKQQFLDEVGDRFLIPKLEAGFSRRDVEAVLDKYDPDIVVYDQLDKINGFNADREDLVLGKKYQWARELAKDSHAAIGVCQADGTAEGVRYLTMEHVANAKTAKQAEADFILGIGKAREPELEYVRYLHAIKNKLFGDVDSIPSLKHGRFETIINPGVARYEDTIEYA